MSKVKADIVDIFSSIQGEGVFLGARQIFIRFKQCNLKCSYCDEPRDGKATEYTPLELLSEVKYLELSKGPHHSVAITGGEPLVYSEFLKSFLGLLKKAGMTTYLETNGTLPRELDKVIESVDIVAMDFKLPSSTGERPFWDEHLEFLRIASWKKTFVKTIVTENTTKADIVKAVELVKRIKGNIPFVIQPASPLKKEEKMLDNDALMKFVEIGLKHNIDNIRVISQMHKKLGVK
ncbi:MAG: 7-carboxy-7-deazaguanine synthase QueE [Candidatus Omnitrophica bacterium]|nr:7-carboxy-7-deazaguanine synthase QueE [Candidatus Omnitrophota bacterium]